MLVACFPRSSRNFIIFNAIYLNNEGRQHELNQQVYVTCRKVLCNKLFYKLWKIALSFSQTVGVRQKLSCND